MEHKQIIDSQRSTISKVALLQAERTLLSATRMSSTEMAAQCADHSFCKASLAAMWAVPICITRSLGALWAPTWSWRPFGPLDFILRALRALRTVRWARLRSGPVKIGLLLKMRHCCENRAFFEIGHFFVENGALFCLFFCISFVLLFFLD